MENTVPSKKQARESQNKIWKFLNTPLIVAIVAGFLSLAGSILYTKQTINKLTIDFQQQITSISNQNQTVVNNESGRTLAMNDEAKIEVEDGSFDIIQAATDFVVREEKSYLDILWDEYSYLYRIPADKTTSYDYWRMEELTDLISAENERLGNNE